MPEFDDEVETHLSLLEERYLRQGMTEEEARMAARRQFGNRTVLAQTRREMSRWFWLSTLWQDVKFGARALRRNPGFTIAAILTLALGIGANTAIFSVVKAVLIDPLPYSNTGSLINIAEVSPTAPDNRDIDYTTVQRLRERLRTCIRLADYRDGHAITRESGRPEVVRVLRVRWEFFDTLGVRMYLGRSFRREEDQPDRRAEIILSYSLWKRRFGGDRHIIGRALRFDQSLLTVVGVLPPEYLPLIKTISELPPEAYLPSGLNPFNSCHDCRGVYAIGRIRPGVSVEQARAEIDGALRDIARKDPKAHYADSHARVTPLRDLLLGNTGTAMWTVMGAVGLVLLIACANVANLLLARGAGREQEMSIRAALGAGRLRLVRQLLTESLLLAAGGGACGIAIALCGTQALARLAPVQLPRIQETRVDLTVLAYACAASVVTGLLFGLVPAWRASRIVSGTRITAGNKLRDALAVAEIALAFVLAMGAGLMVKSYTRLLRVDTGYDPHGVLTLSANLGAHEDDRDGGLSYYAHVLERLRATPGVEGAALSSVIPMDYISTAPVFLKERPLPAGKEAPMLDLYSVSRDYFRVMRVRLLRGRAFGLRDRAETERVAIISAACARALFQGLEPIGQYVRVGEGPDRPWMRVIGIAADIHQRSLDVEPVGAVYMAQEQEVVSGYYRLLVRTKGEPAKMEGPVRAAFVAVDPMEPVFHVKPLDEYFAGRLAQRTFALALLLILGVLALVLAVLGVYGVIAYSVATRTREMGIRIALGASRGNVVAMVLRHGARLTAAGLAIGVPASYAVTRAIAGLLFEVRPDDAGTALAVTTVLAGSAMIAAFVPARRAASADAMVALRTE